MSGKEHSAKIKDLNYLDDYSLLGFGLKVEGYDNDAEHTYYFSLDVHERNKLKREGNWKEDKVVEKLQALEKEIENDSKAEITVEEDGADLDRMDAVREVAKILDQY